MYHNRVQHYFNSLAEPRPPIAGSQLGGFMLVPLGGLSLPVQHATMAQRILYEMAFAAAMARRVAHFAGLRLVRCRDLTQEAHSQYP